MPIIKRSSIDAIKERVNIYDVVSPYVTLRKTGANWRGLSPFSQEKTPSFYVLPDKNIFKCFSSGHAGDVFRFIQLKEGLNFQEAAESLAERFSIPLEYEAGGASKETLSLKKELFQIHEDAATFFHLCFMSDKEGGAWIRNYWTEERRFKLETAEDFKIGFAPVNGRTLLSYLEKKGFSFEALKESGLFYTSKEPNSTARWKARFEGRLMIPIRDIQGRIIAFTARQLSITPESDPAREAKYINTPETPLFHKSNVLFGLDRARTEVKEEAPFLLVEGQLDVIRCWESGLKTAIAPQGTAVTDGQLNLLHRYHGALHCLLDGDSAGQKAALRLLPMALKAGLELSFIPLPPGQDPDSLLLSDGASGLERLIQQAITPMQFASRALLPQNRPPSLSEKAAALEALYEILSAAPSAVTQESYLEELSLLTQTDRQAISQDFGQFQRNKGRKFTRSAPESPKNITEKLTTAEYELLMLILHFEDVAAGLAPLLNPEWVDIGTIQGRLLVRLLAEIEEHPNQPISECLQDLLETDEERDCVYTLLSQDPPFESPIRCANTCLETVYKKHLNIRKQALENKINQHLSGNKETLQALQRERLELRQKLLNPPRLEKTLSSNHA